MKRIFILLVVAFSLIFVISFVIAANSCQMKSPFPYGPDTFGPEIIKGLAYCSQSPVNGECFNYEGDVEACCWDGYSSGQNFLYNPWSLEQFEAFKNVYSDYFEPHDVMNGGLSSSDNGDIKVQAACCPSGVKARFEHFPLRTSDIVGIAWEEYDFFCCEKGKNSYRFDYSGDSDGSSGEYSTSICCSEGSEGYRPGTIKEINLIDDNSYFKPDVACCNKQPEDVGIKICKGKGDNLENGVCCHLSRSSVTNEALQTTNTLCGYINVNDANSAATCSGGVCPPGQIQKTCTMPYCPPGVSGSGTVTYCAAA